MERRTFLQMGLAAPAVLMLGGAGARAQAKFPTRPVRMVVPYAAGGNFDVVGRLIAKNLTESLGQAVYIENKAGADGLIGGTDVARASPDGYSILFGGSSTHVISPILAEKPTYDPVKDFAQLALVAVQPQCLVVNSDFPAKTLAEFVEQVNANPGKYSYGAVSGGLRLGVELLRQQVGKLDLVAVPYRSTPAALQDVMANRIQAIQSHPATVLGHHRSGKLRILAVYSEKRLGVIPEVPTSAESGVPGLLHSTFSLFCTTAGAPKHAVDILGKAFHAAMQDKSFTQTLERDGMTPITDYGPERTTEFVREQIERLTPLLKKLKV